MSQKPARASFVERAVGALVSPPDGFPVLSQVVARWLPPWFDVSSPDPTLPSLAGKPTVDSCGLSTKRRVHVSRDAGAPVSLSARKSPHFCLEYRWRARTNSIIDHYSRTSLEAKGDVHAELLR